jgi:uncharacterized protein YdeI (YjbR/CyaY-like superfamily)
MRAKAAATKEAIATPAFVSDALTRAERAAFEAMPPSHRREYVNWILEAKKTETRERRIEALRVKMRERAAKP